MEPTIVVSSQDPGTWSRRVSVSWPAAGWNARGDNPIAHGGSGTAPDGFDLLGAALGVCMVTTLIAMAEREHIGLRRADALVATKAHKRSTWLAPYIRDFRCDIYLEGDIDEAQRARLEELTVAACGVRETLSRASAVTEQVHIGPPPEREARREPPATRPGVGSRER